MSSIQMRVEALLAQNLKPAREAPQSFGYKDSRQSYQDPDDDSQYVVRVDESTRSLEAASPNTHEEILLAMEEAKKSGIELIKLKKLDSSEEEKKIKMLELAFEEAKNKTRSIKDVSADLFGDKKSDGNLKFQKSLKKLSTHLSDFIQTTAIISGTSKKKLDAQGHKRRSKHRPTLVHEFQIGSDKKDKSSHFVMYIPAGRFTKRQMKLRGLQGHTDEGSSHSTTSHNKKGLVHGNSNFARMIVGKKGKDGSVTILHDSFTGPGARMPYKDLAGADKYKSMAVKSITFMNQEEIIQGVAQRIYDQKLAGKSTSEMEALFEIENIPLPIKDEDDASYKEGLIKAYFKKVDLVETYTQVISPGQGKVPLADGSDANVAQFEYVRDAIRAFDGGNDLPLEIQTDKESTLEVKGQYKGRHAAFGVNYFKSSSDSVAASQNTRFMNQIIDDTLDSLPDPEVLLDLSKIAAPSDEEAKEQLEIIQSNYTALKTTLAQFKASVSDIQEVINKKSESLNEIKADYRDKMMDYAEKYQAYVKGGKDPGSFEDLKKSLIVLNTMEKAIKKTEKEIDGLHGKIESKRKALFNSSNIQEQVTALRKSIKTYSTAGYTKPDSVDLKALVSTHNKMAMLTDAQDLYYNKKWVDDKKNFVLQSLVGTLSTELGHANTKGCKSNNDRGQRLAQKISGNALFTSQSVDGLYDGDYFKPEVKKASPKKLSNSNDERTPLLEGQKQRAQSDELRTEVNRALMTIQTLHHTANTGVGGGKFSIRSKRNFADNGLLGKVASLAKFDDIGASKVFNKKNIPEIVLGVVTGGLYYLGKLLYNKAAKAFHNSQLKKQVKTLRKEADTISPAALQDFKGSEAKTIRGLDARRVTLDHLSHLDERTEERDDVGVAIKEKKPEHIQVAPPAPEEEEEKVGSLDKSPFNLNP